ncbi:MAG: FAD-binding oxidoreductase [Pseudomonadota bacterium]
MSRVVIIGAGIIGAAIAERVAAAGRDVTVVDGGVPGSTSASFGWINASYFLDDAHFRLRAEGLRSWRALTERFDLPVTWQGTLHWGEDDLAATEIALRDLGYPVERLSMAGITALEPSLRCVPEMALRYPSEAAADAAGTATALLAAACDAGARAIYGQRVRSILAGDGRVVGVETDAGLIPADDVILAAGPGCTALLKPLGLEFPITRAPGDLLVTRPTVPMLAHILVVPEEIRQAPDGRFHLPSSVRIDPVTAQPEPFCIDKTGDAAMARLSRLLPVDGLDWERVTRGERPMPADGLPVIGATGLTGLTVACMHSGVTLAALVGELMVKVLEGARPEILDPYRLSRF